MTNSNREGGESVDVEVVDDVLGLLNILEQVPTASRKGQRHTL